MFWVVLQVAYVIIAITWGFSQSTIPQIQTLAPTTLAPTLPPTTLAPTLTPTNAPT